eukprot:gb/GECH01002316.1/.p1 GENE.gb/GECH01002316.1/~~gb/GECH01002316.1/.p1  ORF type:complete len:197 (+),score=64.41 gb/GECH01002316.1/:1-591(+)
MSSQEQSHHQNEHHQKPSTGVIIDMDSEPVLGGLPFAFESQFPPQLDGLISKESFSNTISRINKTIQLNVPCTGKTQFFPHICHHLYNMCSRAFHSSSNQEQDTQENQNQNHRNLNSSNPMITIPESTEPGAQQETEDSDVAHDLSLSYAAETAIDELRHVLQEENQKKEYRSHGILWKLEILQDSSWIEVYVPHQ